MIHINAFIIVLGFIQNEYIDCSYQSKTKIPSIMNTEASQWLNIPRRWSQQYIINQSSNEINRSLQQLELLNENGIRQFDRQSIDGVPMEIFYELSRKRRSAN